MCVSDLSDGGSVRCKEIITCAPVCLPVVHLCADLRCGAGDDRGLQVPAQAAYRPHPPREQWRLPGQPCSAMGPGGGDRTSSQTGISSEPFGWVSKLARSIQHVGNRLIN